MKNEISKLVSVVAVSMFLTACGGSSGGDSDGAASENSNSGSGSSDSGNSGSGNSGSGNTGSGNTGSGNTGSGNSEGSNDTLASPITPLTLEATTILGTKQKAGFSGDIEVVKKEFTNQDGTKFELFEYQLKSGIANMNVNDVLRVESTRFDCPASNTQLKGKGSGMVTYNYKAGTVALKATNSGFSVDCTYKIAPFTGTTIADKDSIETLFNDWGEDYEENHLSMQGSSCPKATPDNTKPENEKAPTEEELAQIVKEITNCNIEIVKNITVTDENNKIHKVAQAGGSLSFGFLVLLMTGLFRRFKTVNSHG